MTKPMTDERLKFFLDSSKACERELAREIRHHRHELAIKKHRIRFLEREKEMTEPMTDEQEDKERIDISWWVTHERPEHLSKYLEQCGEIRRLREENERLKLENASVWKLVNSRADENNKLCKLADAVREWDEARDASASTVVRKLHLALRELDEGEK